MSKFVDYVSSCQPDQLYDVMDQALVVQETFEEGNVDRVFEESEKLDQFVHCASERLSANTLVEVHTAKALESFLQGQPEESRRRLTAAVAIDAPATHFMRSPLTTHELMGISRTSHDTGFAGDFSYQPLKPLLNVTWYVNGEVSPHVPRETSFSLQAIAGEGEVVYSGYHSSARELNGKFYRSIKKRLAVLDQ